MDDHISFAAAEVDQPIGTFYVGVMSAQDVLAISYADVRRIEDRDIEKVIGIQRPLDPERVEEIRQYVKTVDASFPTSIILAILIFPKCGPYTHKVVFHTDRSGDTSGHRQ